MKHVLAFLVHASPAPSPTSGTTWQLPSGYDKAYSNGRGEIIMTNDVLNHPNTQNLGMGDWSEMNVRR